MSGGTAQKQVRPRVWQQKPSRKVRQTQLFSYTSTNLDSRKESSEEYLSSVLHRTQQMKQRGSNTTPEGAFEDQRASNLMLIPLVWVSITGIDTSCLELSCSPWNIWCFRENQFHQIPFKASTVSFSCPETSQKHFCSFIMQTPRSKAPGREGGDSHPPLCEVTVLTTAPSCPPPTPTPQPDHTGWRTSSDSNSSEVNRNTKHSQLLTAVPALSLRWDVPCPHRKCCKVKLQRAICHDFLRLAHPTHKHTSCNRMRRRQQMWGLLWRRCSRRFVVLQTCKKK